MINDALHAIILLGFGVGLFLAIMLASAVGIGGQP